MREIKFRGKRLDGKWAYGSLVIGTDRKTVYIFTEEGAQWNVLPETVGQFTGLKDKNGKELYEGDILEVTSELTTNFGKTPTGRFQTSYFEVTWGEEGWKTKVLKSKHIVVGSLWGLIIEAKYGTICGNIYENPELLEK